MHVVNCDTYLHLHDIVIAFVVRGKYLWRFVARLLIWFEREKRRIQGATSIQYEIDARTRLANISSRLCFGRSVSCLPG